MVPVFDEEAKYPQSNVKDKGVSAPRVALAVGPCSTTHVTFVRVSCTLTREIIWEWVSRVGWHGSLPSSTL